MVAFSPADFFGGNWTADMAVSSHRLYFTEFSPRMTVGLEIKGNVISGDDDESSSVLFGHAFEPRNRFND